GEGALTPGQVEEDRAAASGARVGGQQVAVARRIRLPGGRGTRGSGPSGRMRRHTGSGVTVDHGRRAGRGRCAGRAWFARRGGRGGGGGGGGRGGALGAGRTSGSWGARPAFAATRRRWACPCPASRRPTARPPCRSAARRRRAPGRRWRRPPQPSR